MLKVRAWGIPLWRIRSTILSHSSHNFHLARSSVEMLALMQIANYTGYQGSHLQWGVLLLGWFLTQNQWYSSTTTKLSFKCLFKWQYVLKMTIVYPNWRSLSRHLSYIHFCPLPWDSSWPSPSLFHFLLYFPQWSTLSYSSAFGCLRDISWIL